MMWCIVYLLCSIAVLGRSHLCCWNECKGGCYNPGTHCAMSSDNCANCGAIWCPTENKDDTPTITPEQRAKDIVKSMTPKEKYTMLNGIGWSSGNPAQGMYVGNIPAIPRLKIPSINMQDGPQGFRTLVSQQYGEVTSWPCSLAVTSTWDLDLMYSWGVAMGTECRAKGAIQLLGPAINFHRVAKGGRNAEFIPGEDPHLGGMMAASYVSGLQSQKVMATTKHFVLNNQETNRGSVSSNVDDRTAHEIYLPSFEAAVKAGSASVMCSYNRVNGTYACQDANTLNNILRGEFGFQGWVMTDWWAAHSTSCMQGLDQDQPGTDGYFSDANLASKCGSHVDEMVYRIILQMIVVGVFDDSVCNSDNQGCDHYLYSAVATTASHTTLARNIGSHAATLLQNDGVLPIDNLPKGSTIGIIGTACNSPYNLQGMERQWNLGNYYIMGGSGRVINPNTVTILEGIQARATAAGYKVLYDGSNDVKNSTETLKKSHVGIICGATTSTEGNDRAHLRVDQDAFISQVLSAKPSTTPVIVLLQTPGVVLTDWRAKANAMFNMFLAGEQTGNAWADVLFGDVNPSGKLPVTFPISEADVIAPCPSQSCDYTEGLFVGYRGMEKKQVAFPFGHGLSYTSFKYTWVTLPNTKCAQPYVICMEFNVANSGNRNGTEIAQVYIEFPASAGEPPLQLRGFKKVDLAVGTKQNVSFGFIPRDLSIWDIRSSKWQVQSGAFGVRVGSSSRDIRLVAPFKWP